MTSLTPQHLVNAARNRNWPQLLEMSNLLIQGGVKVEGFFWAGLAQKNMGRTEQAEASFRACLSLNPDRYDATIECAELYMSMGRYGEAIHNLEDAIGLAKDNAFYLHKAGVILERAGLPDQAYPVFEAALNLHPDNRLIQFDLAVSATKIGQLVPAQTQFEAILDQAPDHQRAHYELAKLGRGDRKAHLDAMEKILPASSLFESDSRFVFLLFALGKTCEDLGAHEKAFDYYARGNQAAHAIAKKSGYDVSSDIARLESIRSNFDAAACQSDVHVNVGSGAPIFIVGLPRSGTTLLEKILTGHESIETMDETLELELSVKSYFGRTNRADLTARDIERLAQATDSASIIQSYLEKTAYRRTERPFYIEKYPPNYQYMGLITRHLPNAKILFIRRHPLDNCFGLYKQPHFPYAMELSDLGRFYEAYKRIERHWAEILGDRIHIIDYEGLVREPEATTQHVMEYLGLTYHADMLRIEDRQDSSLSASSIQIREKISTASIGKWKRFETQLQPLVKILTEAGIDLS